MLIPHEIAGFSREEEGYAPLAGPNHSSPNADHGYQRDYIILITGAQVVMTSHAVVMRYTDMVGRWRSWEPVGQQEYVEKTVEG